jgi:DNA-binding NarL/FixJ family response regulator
MPRSREEKRLSVTAKSCSRRATLVAESVHFGTPRALFEGGAGVPRRRWRGREGAYAVIRVVLLEPDYWRRRGVLTVLQESQKIEVVDGERSPADLVLLSYNRISERGLEEIPRARSRYGCDVLVYGESNDLSLAAEVFRAGAPGYYVENGSPAMLCLAVEVVSGGKIWGSREALMLALQRAAERTAQPQSAPLEPQEVELLTLLHEGLSNKEIGERVGLAAATIKTRLNRLYKRFGVTSRLQLLSAALRRGMIAVGREE